MKTNLIILFLFTSLCANAQWGAPYTNSWITYDKSYVKLGVMQKGIHRIPFTSLPATFVTSQPDKFQLWYRGKQVAILSTSNNEILFYGVPNDGSSDSLLYRPMSSRINPYFSQYSDESSYFLTVGDSAGLRASIINKPVDSSSSNLTYHIAQDETTFNDNYSLSTEFPIRPTFFNSFFELGASNTGKVQLTGKLSINNIALKNYYPNSNEKVSIKLLVHGRSNNDRQIEVYVGKTEASLRIVKSISNSGFDATEYKFDLLDGDLDEEHKGILALKSVSTNSLDRFSQTYYIVNYPQTLDVKGVTTKEFNLASGSSLWNNLTILNPPATAQVLDITDITQPVIYLNSANNNINIARKVAKQVKLLITNEQVTVPAAKISLVTFSKPDVASANYIIITSENLRTGANNYANYRSSKPGGGFKTAVIEIKDIYNQFNYGEPSPLAIRRFVDFMLSDGNKERYLFLIGKSITHHERMKRELPDEVPTIGYPGSDVLLVEGLAGSLKDIAAIPIGRLPAATNEVINDYLQKVRDYETNASNEYGWRKNVLHLNGGKTSAEISQLKGMLNDLVPDVTNGIVGGKVIPFVKQQGIGEVESVNITPEVNNGVGLITYFGHGSVTVTDLDMGYATDASRGYNNKLKYPMMYFNGCGVGNIFSGRSNPNANTSDRYSLSMDWLLAANRGSIAIIANSFESFVSPSEDYLSQLYQYMFIDSLTANLSIGKIQVAVAQKIATKDNNIYSIANIHQSILQGDPALRLVTVESPDYSLDPYESISVYSESSDKTIGLSTNLRLSIAFDNKGRYAKGQKIPVQITYHYNDENKIVNELIESFPYQDTLVVSFSNDKNIQRIEVFIDPKNTIAELSKSNNIAELIIDWDVAQNETLYPSTRVKDVIPPLIEVSVNNRLIANNDVILPNPEIKVLLKDDRFITADSSLIDIYIKDCQDDNCDFKKLNYSLLNNIEIDSINNRSMQLIYRTQDLNAGSYELLVNARDASGNTSIQPYRVRFQIIDVLTDNVKVISSPNPATTYVKFQTSIGKSLNTSLSAQYLIYNLNGVLIYNEESKAIISGNNTWYWNPKLQSSGLYLYKVLIKDGNVVTNIIKGKIVLVH